MRGPRPALRRKGGKEAALRPRLGACRVPAAGAATGGRPAGPERGQVLAPVRDRAPQRVGAGATGRSNRFGREVLTKGS